eukprot:TRINITY_DN1720_c0_g1_i3.p2 TRINITY_DN1720_c0_g1~~TRINITY_DN1720_c0_g1_i3.p2  ORF type:complete len:419 (-),score=136.94 TRINITY_DN1720_c0_g1_i3:65-1321(-)
MSINDSYPHDDLDGQFMKAVAEFDVGVRNESILYGIQDDSKGFFGGDWELVEKLRKIMTPEEIQKQHEIIEQAQKDAIQRGEMVDWERVLSIPPGLFDDVGDTTPERSEETEQLVAKAKERAREIIKEKEREEIDSILSLKEAIKGAVGVLKGEEKQTSELMKKEGLITKEEIDPIVYERLFGTTNRLTGEYFKYIKETQEALDSGLSSPSHIDPKVRKVLDNRISDQMLGTLLRQLRDDYITQGKGKHRRGMTEEMASAEWSDGSLLASFKTGHELDLNPEEEENERFKDRTLELQNQIIRFLKSSLAAEEKKPDDLELPEVDKKKESERQEILDQKVQSTLVMRSLEKILSKKLKWGTSAPLPARSKNENVSTKDPSPEGFKLNVRDYSWFESFKNYKEQLSKEDREKLSQSISKI